MTVLCVDDIPAVAITDLCDRYHLRMEKAAAGQSIKGSFWGEPEAGIIADCVYLRGDTPVHSWLHELCHIICISAQQRRSLHTNANSDDEEEAAVCYLQIVLAGSIAEVGRERIMRDMDTWGYSFPEGQTRAWFAAASESRRWLLDRGLLKASGEASHWLC